MNSKLWLFLAWGLMSAPSFAATPDVKMLFVNNVFTPIWQADSSIWFLLFNGAVGLIAMRRLFH